MGGARLGSAQQPGGKRPWKVAPRLPMPKASTASLLTLLAARRRAPWKPVSVPGLIEPVVVRSELGMDGGACSPGCPGRPQGRICLAQVG